MFCKIISGEISTYFVAKTDNVVAFYDINPLAPTHILILPKEHVKSFLDINVTHSGLISKMISLAQKLIKNYNLEGAYKMVFHGGKYQHISHLHWHLLADKPTNPTTVRKVV